MRIAESKLRRLIRSVILESQENLYHPSRMQSECLPSTEGLGMPFKDFYEISGKLHDKFGNKNKIPLSMLPKDCLNLLNSKRWESAFGIETRNPRGFLRGRDFDLENNDISGPILVLKDKGKYDPASVEPGMGALIQDLKSFYWHNLGGLTDRLKSQFSSTSDYN